VIGREDMQKCCEGLLECTGWMAWGLDCDGSNMVLRSEEEGHSWPNALCMP
jgi:hypothetical protein